jgi:transposase
MLKMDQVHVVRYKALVEGQPIRRVAREVGISRNTVRKYLKVSEPTRNEQRARARPVLEKVAPRIDELLEEWSTRTTPKQRITGTRIYQQLIEEGCNVGITTVREYLHEKRRQEKEVYIPLVHRAGDEAQVDFFQVTVDEDGIRRKPWKFLMRLMYSKRDFVWLYDHCDQLAFLDGHVRAFAYFGGVPARVVYDNLTAAVKLQVRSKRELTERFRALVSHYLFEPCFARPGEGHDKGGVEARGKGIRLKHLTPIPRGQCLSEIASDLLTAVEKAGKRKVDREGKSVVERFAEEANKLRALPQWPFEARAVKLIQVSKQALVRIDKVEYSVPSHWARLEATAYIGVEDIRITCYNEEVTVTKKRRGTRQVSYRHYLQQLAHKPQALRQVAPELLAELGEPYGKLWKVLACTHGEREGARVLAKILAAVLDYGEGAVRHAIEQALASGRQDLLALAPRLHQAPVQRKVPVPVALQGYPIEAGCAADYDILLVGGEG